MMRIYALLKSQALRRLPDSLLRVLKARHYFRALLRFDVADEPDAALLPFVVVPGTTAVDLGANIGVYTKLLSELVGASGRVVSVEPIPDTFAILRNNITRLKLKNVSLVNAAVSGSEGTATMAIPEYPSGGLNFYESQLVHDGAEVPVTSRRVAVRTTTLDNLVDDPRVVSFIKCDVEGYEGAVFAGAARVIRDGSPVWLIEISENPDTPGTTAQIIVERLASRGYSPWLLAGDRLRVRQQGDRSTNYFFLTDEHVERIRAKAPALISP